MTTPDFDELDNIRVSQLINNENCAWDENFFAAMFIEVDQYNILRNLISLRKVIDKLMWMHEKKGECVVHSTYNFIHENKVVMNTQQESHFWMKFWSIKVSPKVLDMS